MESKIENYQDTINYLKNKYTNIQTYYEHLALVLTIHELGNQLVKKINNLEINLEKLKKLIVCFDEINTSFDEINTSLDEIIDCYSYNFK